MSFSFFKGFCEFIKFINYKARPIIKILSLNTRIKANTFPFPKTKQIIQIQLRYLFRN